MNLVDVAILLLMILSAALGYRSGLIQAFCSLAGLIAGIAIASHNYKRFGAELAPLVKSKPLSDAIWFCLIALAVMLAVGLFGMLLKKAIHGVGLGWLDRILGLLFGILRGAVLVTLCIVTLAAFFPETLWLSDAQLSRYFLGPTHLTVQVTAQDLKRRIEDGLHVLEKNSKELLREK